MTRCQVDGCTSTIHAKGYCQTHYMRVRRTDSTEVTRLTITTCTIDSCTKKHAARGLCSTHISRLKRTGTTDPRPTPRDRVWDFVQRGPVDACWLWTGPINNAGYGRIGREYAHRVICELTNGKPTAGQVVLHACDNPPCVNPDHLTWGTQSDNVRESYQKGRR